MSCRALHPRAATPSPRFFGTLSFGLLLGFVTEDVRQRFEVLRSGAFPVQASDGGPVERCNK